VERSCTSRGKSTKEKWNVFPLRPLSGGWNTEVRTTCHRHLKKCGTHLNADTTSAGTWHVRTRSFGVVSACRRVSACRISGLAQARAYIGNALPAHGTCVHEHILLHNRATQPGDREDARRTEKDAQSSSRRTDCSQQHNSGQ
jgi:hypothetical protein